MDLSDSCSLRGLTLRIPDRYAVSPLAFLMLRGLTCSIPVRYVIAPLAAAGRVTRASCGSQQLQKQRPVTLQERPVAPAAAEQSPTSPRGVRGLALS